MTFATTRNLTILGVIQIVQAVAVAASAIFDGNLVTNPDWGVLVTSIITGVGLILAKGAGTTGAQSVGGTPIA